jgi:hypothetical protein
MKTIAIVGAMTFLVLTGTTLSICPTPVRPTIPACQEDEIVTGLGEFNGAERGWTSYECQNLDDFVDFVNRERIGGQP